MTKTALLVFALLLFPNSGTGENRISVAQLRCEGRMNPLGVDARSPRFSWRLHSDARGASQSAYRILVSDDIDALNSGRGTCWDTGKILSDQSLLIPYGGQNLESATRYFWKIKVWNQSGEDSEWSDVAHWEMGLLEDRNWRGARWICFRELPDSLRIVPGVHGSGNDLGSRGIQRTVVPMFRKEFRSEKPVESARLFISGVGHYDASINGRGVGNGLLAPGWTHYDKRCLYNVFDVTTLLRQGANAIGVIAGNGFYNINRERYRKLVIAFGEPSIICRLTLRHNDGSETTLVSGSDWSCAPSPITYTSIFGGEDYDARKEQRGWDTPDFDAAGWANAIETTGPAGKLVAEADNPVRVMEVFEPRRHVRVNSSVHFFDFGQNASGIPEIVVHGNKGDVITLKPGELSHGDSAVNQRASGEPHFYTYTLKGSGTETWRPRFTYYGFRYLIVQGATVDSEDANGLPVLHSVRFLHTRNSTPGVGTFTSSDTLLNRIHSLILWAIRSNLQSVVTDCPHREKLGWLEQTHLMGGSIAYNYTLASLYHKIVHDMIDAQTPEGLVPDIAPEYVEFLAGFRDSPEWGSAAVIVPWIVYRWYGDTSLLSTAWPMMKRYTAYLSTRAKDGILSHGLGDWYDLGPRFPGEAQLTPIALTATASYYHDLEILRQVANVLGRSADEREAAAHASLVKDAFNKTFFDERSGVYATGSQTSMAMPLCVGIVDPSHRSRVLANLIDSITASGKALTAGDVGFHYLVHALTDGGASQLVYEMISRDDVPGYGFQLRKGATALTESWAALSEVSNNHLMLGHVMEWFYAGLAGITQEATSIGFKRIVIKPSAVRGLRSATATYESPYGLIRSSWERGDGKFTLDVEIPVNTTSRVILPPSPKALPMEGGKPLGGRFEVEPAEDGSTIIRVPSGKYSFVVGF